ncbi:MAG: glycoside hydrolase family 15 protein [Mycobacteriales bacterium]
MGNLIGDYAVLGDCHTSALLGRDGSIDWLCFPRPDSPAVFCHLLDPDHGGNFAVRVAGAEVSRHYVDRTNVLQTTWTTAAGGVLEVTDAMPVAPFDPTAPAAVTPGRGVLRRLRCLAGEVTASVRVTPRFEYGLVVPRLITPSPFVADFVGGGSAMRVRASRPLDRRDAATLRRGDVLAADWALAGGDEAWVDARWYPAHLAPRDVPEPDIGGWRRDLEETVGFWRDWVGGLRYDGDYAQAVLRSALVLKTLTYAPTGAVLATATTSLPEHPGGERNWDYRYVWIRDATLTLTSLFTLGFQAEAAAFKAWLERTGAGRPQDLQIMYGVEGERLLPEIELGHLAGHLGSRPVRIGNGAVKQLQLDSFGQLLEAAYLFARAGGEITSDNWTYLAGLADLCCARWREPDQGIWEIRDEPRHFTHSKLNCWLALKRAGQLAAMLGRPASPGWAVEQEAVRSYLLADAAPGGWFGQARGHPVADAAALLVPALGLLPADHPAVSRTVEAVVRDLAAAGTGLLRRYHAPDGLPGSEGAFLLCSFWLVDVLTFSGRLDEATRLLEALLGLAGDVGIYAEEVDPVTGQQLGNLPQAFTHMALVTSCAHLSAARRGALPLGQAVDFAECALDRLLHPAPGVL